MDFDEVIAAMKICEQSPGFSVYDHGVSVLDYFRDLVGEQKLTWKLPSWFIENRQNLCSNTYAVLFIYDYLIFHDCGKPYCRTIDENGKTHFPNHAEKSAEIWREIGGHSIVEKLIRNDMVIHTATAEEITQKLNNEWSVQDACTLLLASLSELHSNASMFGGQNTESFKIKQKKLDRRGNLICKYLFVDKPESSGIMR